MNLRDGCGGRCSGVQSTQLVRLGSTLVQVSVKRGDTVEMGQSLVVLEAMKLNHTVSAPVAGVVGGVHIQVGRQVEEGQHLLTIQEPKEDDKKETGEKEESGKEG